MACIGTQEEMQPAQAQEVVTSSSWFVPSLQLSPFSDWALRRRSLFGISFLLIPSRFLRKCTNDALQKSWMFPPIQPCLHQFSGKGVNILFLSRNPQNSARGPQYKYFMPRFWLISFTSLHYVYSLTLLAGWTAFSPFCISLCRAQAQRKNPCPWKRVFECQLQRYWR